MLRFKLLLLCTFVVYDTENNIVWLWLLIEIPLLISIAHLLLTITLEEKRQENNVKIKYLCKHLNLLILLFFSTFSPFSSSFRLIFAFGACESNMSTVDGGGGCCVLCVETSCMPFIKRHKINMPHNL